MSSQPYSLNACHPKPCPTTTMDEGQGLWVDQRHGGHRERITQISGGGKKCEWGPQKNAMQNRQK